MAARSHGAVDACGRWSIISIVRVSSPNRRGWPPNFRQPHKSATGHRIQGGQKLHLAVTRVPFISDNGLSLKLPMFSQNWRFEKELPVILSVNWC